MHFVYIDDSGNSNVSCFSALLIPADTWRSSLSFLMGSRKAMRSSDGVYIAKELHSTDWNAGKGRVAKHPVSKETRVSLFNFFLSSIAMLPGIQIINACVSLKEKDRAFQYLLQRIENNMSRAGSSCVIFSDEGKSYDAIRRRMSHFNYIPSQFGDWGDGQNAKNLKSSRILEDLVYRDSAKSIFIQAADACAYALLRSEQSLPSKDKLGLHKSFSILEGVLVKQAFAKDHRKLGIIR
jgi:hypothetical protein